MPGTSGTAVAGKPTDVTDRDRLNVVELLLAGKTVRETAELLNLHPTRVEMIGSAQGHPNVKRLEWNRDLLQQHLEAAARPKPAPAPKAKAETVPDPTDSAAPAPAAAPGPVEVPTATPAPDEIAGLLAAGLASKQSRIRTIAARLEAVAVELASRLEAERVQAERREVERQERAAATAEVAALQKQLAEARAKLNPGVTSAKVRAWAKTAGVPVAGNGRVPADVLAQYRAAHGLVAP